MSGTSTISIGVDGEATGASTNIGVRALASSQNINHGVSGSATGPGINYGLSGVASGGVSNYGVHGTAPTSAGNWAGYFDGNTHVAGSLGIGTISPIRPLHVSNGSVGAIAPNGNSLVVLEQNANNYIQMFSPDGDETGLLFGRATLNIKGGIIANPIDGLQFRTGGNSTRMTLDAAGNLGIGTGTPTASLHIAANSGNVLIGNGGCPVGQTTIGFLSPMSGCSNYAIRGGASDLFINRPIGGAIHVREGNGTGQFVIASGGNVGIGTTTPADTLVVNGLVRVATLGPAGSVSVCRNAFTQLATCSSSARYKSNVTNYRAGFDIIRRLRPVSFNWKEGGMLDLGLVAEEVAAIDPLLTTINDKGEIEGVKYDRVGVVLINVVKEQQAQIDAQKKEIETLKELVCAQNTQAAICKMRSQK
jgi:hypothetical protein